MTREIVDVTYKLTDDMIVTKRYNAAWVNVSNGTLEIYDRGLIAAFAPGQWLSVQRVDPEMEDQPAATE